MGVFLAVAIVGGVVGVRQLDAASTAQVRLAAAREELDGLLRTQLAEETGLRGYVATGERYFLEPAGPGNETFYDHADRLLRYVRQVGLANGPALVNDLNQAHTTWHRAVEQPLLEQRKRPDALAKQTYGKLLTDRMRLDAATLRSGLRNSGDEVEAALRRRINATVATSVGTITAFAIMALVLGLSRAHAVEALAREQSMVAALQQTLRVEGVQLPRTALGYAYTSATREALVGGDLIDTWRVDAERGWFLIADASGKGIEAARHSAFVQYAIRTLAAESEDPAVVVARFNRLFLDTFADPGIFVVLFLGRFDARDGRMTYASAGHATAFVRRSDAIEQLAPTGPIVGLGRDESYGSAAVMLDTGDTVLLATDGVTESRDARGEFLGDEGVMRIARTGPADPQALCDRLVDEVQARSNGTIEDDLAILALRILAVDDPAATPKFTTLGAAP